MTVALEEPEEPIAVSVHRCEAGAFDRFVEAWEKPLYHYTLRLLQNPFDAQEIVQDAFLRAHRALTRQYDEARCRELAVRPWLFRIARNLALNRKRMRYTRVEEPMGEFDDSRIGPFFEEADAGRDVERQQDAAALESALAMLPTESRELIFLRFMEEMSYADISKTTGQNESQLRGKVFRSLKLLRRALTEKGMAHAM